MNTDFNSSAYDAGAIHAAISQTSDIRRQRAIARTGFARVGIARTTFRLGLRIAFALIAAILLESHALAAADVGTGNPVTAVRRIADGIFMIPGEPAPASPSNGGRNANTAFVTGPDGIVVWNTGVSHRHGGQLLARIREVTDQPVRLAVISRAFQDVLFGWSAFADAGIPVWMHRGSDALMRQRCLTCLKRLDTMLGDAMSGTRLAQPSQLLDGSTTITAIGRRLDLIDSGYSSGPNDLMMFDPQTGTLLSGDLVMTSRIPDLQDGRLEGWLSALAAAKTLPIRHVIPNHGAVGGPEAIVRTIAYLEALDEDVADMFQRGVTLSEAVDDAQLPEFAHLESYDENHARNVQLRYLQLESRLFR